MNEVRCIFCDIESDRVVIEENGYSGKKCPQCSLIYISPRPSLDEIVDLYGHDSAHMSAADHISASISGKLYAKHNLRIIRSSIQSGSLLEIGPGAGHFLDEARKAGFEPHGLEFNPIQASHIRNKLQIPCEESPLADSIFGGKQFDVVYHCDVISHFFDPVSDFRRTNEIMKEGAFLIFETGNLGDVDPRYFKHFQQFQYPDHLFFFGVDNLVELLEKTGFEVIKFHRYSILPQLVTMRTMSWAMNSIKRCLSKSDTKVNPSPERSPDGDPSTIHTQSSNPKSLIKGVIKNLILRFYYILRYKIGRIAPHKTRPQTMIVVARKTAG